MATQQNPNPTRKVAVGGIAGAISAILVWIANAYMLPASKPIPPEIASAITTVITFAVSYFTPPSPGDQVTA